jgi:hypothetical protein
LSTTDRGRLQLSTLVITDVPVRGSDPAVWTVVIENVRVEDVLIEQIAVVAPERLGELVGYVSRTEFGADR